MKTEICSYCGEFPGNVIRPNPNHDGTEWKVCPTCDKIIKLQMKISMGNILNHHGGNGDKLIKEATREMSEIAHEAGLDIMCVKIDKNKL